MTIKPEDVPKSVWSEYVDMHVPLFHLVAFLNDCIEAGVVSPPCHCIKHDDGYVIDPGYERRIRVWPGKAYGLNIEHWKGQTE